MNTTTVAVDPAKSVFQLAVADATGTVTRLQKKMERTAYAMPV
jgi:hypothetical protein